jgi:cytochrome c-type protein NapB
MRRTLLVLAGLVLVGTGLALAQPQPPRLTGPDPMTAEVPAPRFATPIVDAGRMMRLYPEQAPTIPHAIDRYEITINANRCLECHRRQFTEATGAPMISVTHFQDRDGQLLADVAPRRYACTACHVTQTDARPLVENTFIDVLRVPPTVTE